MDGQFSLLFVICPSFFFREFGEREKGLSQSTTTPTVADSSPRHPKDPRVDPPLGQRSSMVSAPACTSPRTRVTTHHTHTELYQPI